MYPPLSTLRNSIQRTYAYVSDNLAEDRVEFAIGAITVSGNIGSTLSSVVAMSVQTALWQRLGIKS